MPHTTSLCWTCLITKDTYLHFYCKVSDLSYPSDPKRQLKYIRPFAVLYYQSYSMKTAIF